MKSELNNHWPLPLQIFVSSLFVLGVSGIIWAFMIRPESPEVPKTVTYDDWGTVKRISNCSPSKHAYRCWVWTDKVSFNTKLNLEDFPDEELSEGDRIGRQEICEDGDKTVYWCKNGMCSSISYDDCGE